MEDIVADLHTHTTLSDGKTEPDEVTEIAKENNLDAIALTDHDRVHTDFSRPLEVRDGIDVINSVELRVELEDVGERIDVLGYGVMPTDRLESVLESLRENRIVRAEKIIDLIEDETGVRIEVDIDDSVGRPDIATAIDNNPNLDYSYEEAFDTLIHEDGPCYVSRDIPKFEYGVELLKQSSSLVSLAHPYRYENAEEVLKRTQQLDGVECFYPYDVGNRSGSLDETAANWFDLTMTGGSDAHHPKDTAKSGLDRQHYLQFLSDSNLEFYSHIV